MESKRDIYSLWVQYTTKVNTSTANVRKENVFVVSLTFLLYSVYSRPNVLAGEDLFTKLLV
jgi:hypothetical protein